MIEHGTPRGYWQHKRGGTKACDRCLAAHSEYVTQHRGRKVQALSYDNPYTREADRLLAENPPQIEWRRKNNGVWVHVAIDDPHADMKDRAARSMCINDHEYTEDNTHYRSSGGRECLTCKKDRDRQAEARRTERRRREVLEQVEDEAREVAERFEKHRADNTPLLAAARTEI